MSSSDGTGAARSAVPSEPHIAAAAAGVGDGDGLERDLRGSSLAASTPDPWFDPTPRSAADEPAEADAAQVAGTDETAQWFLPTGRAALLPDSMTESWDDQSQAGTGRAVTAAAVGSPPWDGDSAQPGAGEPPPWETGPWPEPGAPVARPHPAPPADPGPGTAAVADSQPGWLRLLQTKLVLAAGVAGVCLVVAVVVIVTSLSGGSAGCATYPAAVRTAYARAMSDLSGHAAAPVQAADLARAARLANVSAAGEGQITARTALFAMASDLDEAHVDVTAHRALPSALLQRLAADGTALPRSCAS